MSPADRQAMIESMVQGLADRLDQKGDDLAGWLKLVRAYTVLDRKDDALKALGEGQDPVQRQCGRRCSSSMPWRRSLV